MTVLWVQDNGEGMDLDTRTRVLSLFTTRKGKGSRAWTCRLSTASLTLGGDVFIDSVRGTGTCEVFTDPSCSLGADGEPPP